MRKFILYAVSFIFIANTLVVSASIKPCMQDSPKQIELASQSDMPCHEQEPTQHCKDACFCLHFSANQIPFFDADIPSANKIQVKRFLLSRKHITSRNSPPLFRPPIYTS